MWDRDIPPPTKVPRWDFAAAELGHSKGFETKEEAVKCAGAFRRWAKQNDKPWRPLVDTSFCSGWRVWIVEKRERKGKLRSPTIGDVMAAAAKVNSQHFAPLVHDSTPGNAGPILSPSTETDDDIMLSVDTRKNASVTIGKQPEPQPVEVVEEITPTGRRKRKGKEG
jgi:hypothetical protein